MHFNFFEAVAVVGIVHTYVLFKHCGRCCVFDLFESLRISFLVEGNETKQCFMHDSFHIFSISNVFNDRISLISIHHFSMVLFSEAVASITPTKSENILGPKMHCILEKWPYQNFSELYFGFYIDRCSRLK